jgi:hypothetical protein
MCRCHNRSGVGLSDHGFHVGELVHRLTGLPHLGVEGLHPVQELALARVELQLLQRTGVDPLPAIELRLEGALATGQRALGVERLLAGVLVDLQERARPGVALAQRRLDPVDRQATPQATRALEGGLGLGRPLGRLAEGLDVGVHGVGPGRAHRLRDHLAQLGGRHGHDLGLIADRARQLARSGAAPVVAQPRDPARGGADRAVDVGTEHVRGLGLDLIDEPTNARELRQAVLGGLEHAAGRLLRGGHLALPEVSAHRGHLLEQRDLDPVVRPGVARERVGHVGRRVEGALDRRGVGLRRSSAVAVEEIVEVPERLVQRRDRSRGVLVERQRQSHRLGARAHALGRRSHGLRVNVLRRRASARQERVAVARDEVEEPGQVLVDRGRVVGRGRAIGRGRCGSVAIRLAGRRVTRRRRPWPPCQGLRPRPLARAGRRSRRWIARRSPRGPRSRYAAIVIVEVAHRVPPSGRSASRRPQRRRARALDRLVLRRRPVRPSPAPAGFLIISAPDRGHARGSPGVMGEVSGPPLAGCVPATDFSPQPSKPLLLLLFLSRRPTTPRNDGAFRPTSPAFAPIYVGPGALSGSLRRDEADRFGRAGVRHRCVDR